MTAIFTVIKTILDKIPGWIWALALAAALALSFSYKIQRDGWEHKFTQTKMELSETIRGYQERAMTAMTLYRAKEEEWNKTKGELENANKVQAAKNKAAVSILTADNLRMRDKIGQYASGSPASEDTVATCRARATTLGDLLSESMQIQVEGAGDAEDRASDTRTLLKWGREISRPIN